MARDESLGQRLRPGVDWYELILAYAAGELTADDEASIEKYLASHPELAQTVTLYWALRLLYAKDQFETPSSRAISRTKAIFGQGVNRAPALEPVHTLARLLRQRTQFLVLALLGFLILAMSFGVAAASDARPGQNLYQVKRSVESLKLASTFDASQKAELNLKLAGIRIHEINDLISRKEYHLLAEPLAAFESHVENAVHGLGSVPGDEPAHLTTAFHLEEDLVEIRSSLTQAVALSPPEVQSNLNQAILKADIAQAFIQADKELVLKLQQIETPSLPPAAPSREETRPSFAQTEESPAAIVGETRLPHGTLPPSPQSPATLVPPPSQSPTVTVSVTRVQDTATLTPTLTTTNTVVFSTPLPTPSRTLEPAMTVTSLPTAYRTATPTPTLTSVPSRTSTSLPTASRTPTPTASNTHVPSATVTIVLPGDTPVPSPTSTINPPLNTPVATPTPTDVVPTPTATATVPSDTPVPTQTSTETVTTETPVPTYTDINPLQTETAVSTEAPTFIAWTETPTPTDTPTESPFPTESFIDTPTATLPPRETPTEIVPTETPTPTEVADEEIYSPESVPPTATVMVETETPIPDDTPIPYETPAANALQFELGRTFSPARMVLIWFDVIHVPSGMFAR